jgi:hypothetical protein
MRYKLTSAVLWVVATSGLIGQPTRTNAQATQEIGWPRQVGKNGAVLVYYPIMSRM